jgi:quercetin dioxygenase-like cupin family protein
LGVTIGTSAPITPDHATAPERMEWVLIPPEKIVPDHAPDGQAYLFMLAGTIQCFVRPRGDF